MFSEILYNLLMAVVGGGMIVIVRQHRTPRAAMYALAILPVAALVIAVALGGGQGDAFLAAKLLSFGLFIHLPLMLLILGLVISGTARKTSWLFFVGVVVICAAGIDAFFIEPEWLEVTHLEIRSSKIKQTLTIVVIADVQTDEIGDYQRRVFERVMEEKPDLILMAGDYIQVAGSDKRDELNGKLNALMKEVGLHAPWGIYAVKGNVDQADWQDAFKGFEKSVRPFDKTETIDVPGRHDLRITALSMNDSFDPTLTVTGSDRFSICLGHSPNFALGKIKADFLVAGHTHGGQVQIPGVGPIITLSKVPRRWAYGLNDIGNGRKLLVSRGIGMERFNAPRLRFFCRPELVVIKILPE